MRIQGAKIKTNLASVSVTLGYRFNYSELFEKGWNNALDKIKDITHYN